MKLDQLNEKIKTIEANKLSIKRSKQIQLMFESLPQYIIQLLIASSIRCTSFNFRSFTVIISLISVSYGTLNIFLDDCRYNFKIANYALDMLPFFSRPLLTLKFTLNTLVFLQRSFMFILLFYVFSTSGIFLFFILSFLLNFFILNSKIRCIDSLESKTI